MGGSKEVREGSVGMRVLDSEEAQILWMRAPRAGCCRMNEFGEMEEVGSL